MVTVIVQFFIVDNDRNMNIANTPRDHVNYETQLNFNET